MSVIFEGSNGYVVCHEKYLKDVYGTVKKGGKEFDVIPHEHMFLVNSPYAKDAEARKKVTASQSEGSSLSSVSCSARKRISSSFNTRNITIEKVEKIKSVSTTLLEEARKEGLFQYVTSDVDLLDNNKKARDFSQNLYHKSMDWIHPPFDGGNNSDESVIELLRLENFIFPERCRFYCRDVFEMINHVEELGRFDFIVVDPPWWNKYIRRKKAKCSSEGYKMVCNENLKELPFKELLSPQGIIAVWCTNADSHLDDLREEILPAWNARQIAQWTWLKVTRSGHPVCSFSLPPGKQPFEQLIIGVHVNNVGSNLSLEDEKVFMSVPSAVHSHKPPLEDLFRPYLPEKPRCLEVFSRYLLPNWTSWGLEVVKLMHESLFTVIPSLKHANEDNLFL